jgi:AraC-like DNA-binding protein
LAIETTKAVYLIKLIDVLRSAGADAGPVLEAANLDPGAQNDRDTPLPISDYLDAVELAVSRYPEIPDLGFRVGESTTLLEHGVLGYALLSSPTLRDSVQRFVRYQYLQGPLLSMSFEESGTTAALIVVPRRGRWRMSPLAHRYVVQEWLASWNQVCQQVSRSSSFFEHVRLGYSAGDEHNYYEEHLGCTVSFGNDETTAVFPSRRLDRPLEYADESIAALCAVQCERLLETLNLRSGLVAEIHRRLASAPGTVPGMETMAKYMHVGARTLRRQLKAEGTTYQDVVRDFRIAMARHYLEETTLPVSEVAALVGYADATNLYRVFRQLTGYTPREYRDRHRDIG